VSPRGAAQRERDRQPRIGGISDQSARSINRIGSPPVSTKSGRGDGPHLVDQAASSPVVSSRGSRRAMASARQWTRERAGAGHFPDHEKGA
jgi:hypothetical protein